MFLRFSGGVGTDIERESPASSASRSRPAEMLVAMTLAYLIRQTGLPCHITQAARTSACCASKSRQAPELFSLIDSACHVDGDDCAAAPGRGADGTATWQVPNLIYKTGARCA